MHFSMRPLQICIQGGMHQIIQELEKNLLREGGGGTPTLTRRTSRKELDKVGRSRKSSGNWKEVPSASRAVSRDSKNGSRAVSRSKSREKIRSKEREREKSSDSSKNRFSAEKIAGQLQMLKKN